jgi:alpha-L-rhamnosidase
MTSLNHYALGAVADWMHRTVAGLAPASPGYRELTIRPQPGGGLTHARTRHVTPYGPASVGWSLDGDQLTVTAEVPEFCTGTAVIPGLGEPIRVGAGEHQWRTTFVPEPLDARADHLAGA